MKLKNTRLITKIIWGSLVVIWMTLIFVYSGQDSEATSSSSSELTHFILNALTQIGIISACNISTEEFTLWESFIRTTAHFTEYLILGAITFEFIYRTFEVKKAKYFLYPLIFCLLYSITDEVHQYFVPGRAMQFIDFLVDSLGALVSITILFLFTIKLKLFKLKNNIKL